MLRELGFMLREQTTLQDDQVGVKGPVVVFVEDLLEDLRISLTKLVLVIDEHVSQLTGPAGIEQRLIETRRQKSGLDIETPQMSRKKEKATAVRIHEVHSTPS